LTFSNVPNIRANYIDSTGSQVDAISGVTPTNGTWFHCAAVFASVSSRSIYVNGLKVTDTTTMQALNTLTAPDLALLKFSSNIQFWNGGVDDASLWKRVLSDAEVFALYEESRRGYPETIRRQPQRAWSFASAVSPVKFRRTLSELGTRVGSRQPMAGR